MVESVFTWTYKDGVLRISREGDVYMTASGDFAARLVEKIDGGVWNGPQRDMILATCIGALAAHEVGEVRVAEGVRP